MAEPTNIRMERIIQGTTFKPKFLVEDADGTAIDLTTSGYTTWLSIRKQGSTAAATTRSTATSAQREWVTDGTDGYVRFIFSVADTLAMAVGFYNVELFFSNTGTTPDDQLPKGRGIWKVEAPTTTTLTAP